MDFNDPKELNDPNYSMIPSYSMINWKYGLIQKSTVIPPSLMVLLKNNVPLAVLVVVPLRFGIIMAD